MNANPAMATAPIEKPSGRRRRRGSCGVRTGGIVNKSPFPQPELMHQPPDMILMYRMPNLRSIASASFPVVQRSRKNP